MRRRLLALLPFAAALAACGTDAAVPPVAAHSALADSADQMMFGITTYLTSQGVRKVDLQADTAYFFDDNSRIELRSVHMIFYSPMGEKNSVLTSREGTYSERQHAAEARGDVVVVSEDGRRLTTPELRYLQNLDQIASDSAFVLTTPDGRRISGVGFRSDPAMKNVQILHGTSGSGTFTLPGQ